MLEKLELTTLVDLMRRVFANGPKDQVQSRVKSYQIL